MKRPRRQRIYILPTNFGAVFMGGAFVMVLIGASYQNNLVNLLAFFMLGLVFVAMVQTHNNLKDVDVESLETENGFAGDDMILVTLLKNSSRRARFNLETAMRGRKPRNKFADNRPLPPLGQLRFSSAYAVKNRGVYFVKRIAVDSNYPIGLFRAWRALEGDQVKFYVYPEPKGELPLPRTIEHDLEAKRLHSSRGDDFRGHRLFQKGDPLGHVDWKAVARGRPMMIKELNEGSGETLFLDWSQLTRLKNDEEKLSQLALWIKEANRRHITYSLILPDLQIKAGHGPEHTKQCLLALATYGFNGQEKPHEAS